MKKKLITYGLVFLAAMLLVTMAFSGAGAADGSGTVDDPYQIWNLTKNISKYTTWNSTTGVLTIKNPVYQEKTVYYKVMEDINLRENTGYIQISGNNTVVDFNRSTVSITKKYNASLAKSVPALKISGGNVTVSNVNLTVTGDVGANYGIFFTVQNGNVTVKDSQFNFSGVTNRAKSLLGVQIMTKKAKVPGPVKLENCTISNGDAQLHKSQTIAIDSGTGGVIIDGNDVTDVAAGKSGARESVCVRISSMLSGDENAVIIKDTKLSSHSENSGNVGIAIDGTGINDGAKLVIDSVSYNFSFGGYNIWKEECPVKTIVEFNGSNGFAYRNANGDDSFVVCFADASKAASSIPVGNMTFTGGSIPTDYTVDVGASFKEGSIFTEGTLTNATTFAGTVFNSATLNVYNNTTLTSPLSIPNKVRFVVLPDVNLTAYKIAVESGGSLILNESGKIIVTEDGCLTLTTASELNGTIESQDTKGTPVFNVTAGGSSLDLCGILNISKQPDYDKSLDALNVSNGGYLTPNVGSVIIFNDTIQVTDITKLETDLDKLFDNAEIGASILIGGKAYYVCENQGSAGQGTLKLIQIADKVSYVSTNFVDFGTVETGDQPANIDVYLYTNSSKGANIDLSDIVKFECVFSGGIDKTGKLSPSTIGKITVKAPGTSTAGKIAETISVPFDAGKFPQDIDLSVNVIEKTAPAEEEKTAKADLPAIDIRKEEDSVVIVGNSTELTYDTTNSTATLKKSADANVTLTIEGAEIEEIREAAGLRWLNVPNDANITATYESKSADVIDKADTGSFMTTLSLKNVSTDLPTLSGSFDSTLAKTIERQHSTKAMIMVTAKDTEESLEDINDNINVSGTNRLDIVVPKSEITSLSRIEVYHVRSDDVKLLEKVSDYTIESDEENYIVHIDCTDGFSSYVVSEKQLVSSSSSGGNGGATIILTETPTAAPTTAPTAVPTISQTTKPTAKSTQKSPIPFVGILAGLGAAAVLFRLRK